MSVNPDCSVLVVEEEDDDVILVESSNEEDDQEEFQPVKPGGRKLDSTIELDSSSSEEDETPQVEEAIKEEDCSLYQTSVQSPFQTPNPTIQNSTLPTPHDNNCSPVTREVPNRVAVQDTTTSTPFPTPVHPPPPPVSDPFEVRDEFLDESLDKKDLPDSVLTPGVTPVQLNMNTKYTSSILPMSKFNKEEEEPADSAFSSANGSPSLTEPPPPPSSSKNQEETKNSLAIPDSDPVKKDLPQTCSILSCSEGGQAYLVGTAHFSEASNEDVRKVIRLVRPGAVVLELCNLRSSSLKFTEDELMQMASNPPSLRQMIENAKKGMICLGSNCICL